MEQSLSVFIKCCRQPGSYPFVFNTLKHNGFLDKDGYILNTRFSVQDGQRPTCAFMDHLSEKLFKTLKDKNEKALECLYEELTKEYLNGGLILESL